MPVIYLQTLIDAPVKRVFDLSRSVSFHLYSASQTGEKVISSNKKDLLELNDEVIWKAKHLGIWQTLCAKVTVFNEPYYFVDEMVKGAFKSFQHEHHFKDVREGTLMIDNFHYESPLGIVGKIANRMFLIAYMTRFLKKRNTIIKSAAESDLYMKFINV